jgi:hypothetical protein
MKQHANVYTMMLILAFVALVVGSIFLFLEMRSYDMEIRPPANLKAPTVMVTPIATQALV